MLIEKAGEIIPQVLGVRTEDRTGDEVEFVFPDNCPSCSGEVK